MRTYNILHQADDLSSTLGPIWSSIQFDPLQIKFLSLEDIKNSNVSFDLVLQDFQSIQDRLTTSAPFIIQACTIKDPPMNSLTT